MKASEQAAKRRFGWSRCLGRTSIGISAAAVAVAGAAAGPSQTAGASTHHGRHHSAAAATVSIDYIPSSDWSVVKLAMAKGFLARAKINLKLVPVSSLVQEIPLMVSGHLDIGYGSALPTVLAMSHHLPLHLIGALDQDVTRPQGSAVELVVPKNSGIHSVKQLTGRTIGVNALGTPFVYWTREAIDAAGGNSAATHFIALPPPAQVKALQSGQVDALAALQPFASEAVAAGGRDIGDPFQLADGKHPVYTYWAATTSYIHSHRAVLVRFLKAMKKAYTYADAHPAVARHFISVVTKLSPAQVAKEVPLPHWTLAMHMATIHKDEIILRRYQVLAKPVNLKQLIVKIG